MNVTHKNHIYIYIYIYIYINETILKTYSKDGKIKVDLIVMNVHIPFYEYPYSLYPVNSFNLNI